MSDKKMSADLQALWDELTQSEDVRRKRIRKKRFDERARVYARQPETEVNYSDDEVHKLLTFRAGDEQYGIDVSIVTGVRPVEKITRVPGVPGYYRGVINVRGQIISVLDIRRFLGLPDKGVKKSELVLVKAGNLTLALMADRVEEVQVIPRAIVETVDMRYAHGVTPDRLVILDADYLLSDERLIIGEMS